MIDWLVVWGVTKAGGLLVRSVMQELATEGAKEYGKEFFKNSLGKVLRLPEKDLQKEAYGKAIKEFVELFEQQLEMAEVEDEGLKIYEKPLKKFIKDETVKPILGDAFDIDCQCLDTQTLAKGWQRLDLPQLPPEFKWEKLGRFYLRRVRVIIENEEKLREIFLVRAKIQESENIKELVGIKPDYDLEKYAEGLKNEYAHLKLECLDTTTFEEIKLWRMFIPQNVKLCQQFIPQLHDIPKPILLELLERGEITQAELQTEELKIKRQQYLDDKPFLILDLIDRQKHPKIVFLGDPGAGKSSFLQYLALNWAEKSPSDRISEPIPLLVELRIYARDKDENHCQNFLEFFHQGNLFCHLNQLSLNDKLKHGQAIVLFDGLDEVFEPKLREEIVTDIKRFSIEYPQVQIIVTSRWLGYKAEELTHAGFEHFMLQDLDKQQIEDFIQRWHDLAFKNRDDKAFKQQRLQKAIADSGAIRRLAGNPLLLTMMAILNRTQELPRDRPKLYEKASEVLLHQWDFETKEGLIDPELKKYLYNIDLRDKQNILRLVADAMQKGKKGLGANLIYKEELERIIADYLQETGITKRDAFDLTDLIIKQLSHRNFIICSLGGNTFTFVHRTFLEYFCAYHFYEGFKNRNLAGGITLEELKTDVFGKHSLEDSWQEVLCLLIGMLSNEFPPEIPKELINYLVEGVDLVREDIEEIITDLKVLFLAVDCFVELRNPSTHREMSQKLLNLLKDAIEFIEEIVRKTEDYSDIFKVTLRLLKSIFNRLSKIAKLYPKALSYLQQLARNGNNTAIDVLGGNWRDDAQTLSIIQQQALNGNDHAINVLLQYWRDDVQTLPIIQQQARNGNGSTIIIGFLVRYWRDDVQTLPIIQQQARNGNESAINVLAQYWRDDTQTLPIIQQQARNGSEWAINALEEYWRDDAQTLPIIQQQALNGNFNALGVLLHLTSNK